MTARRVYPTPFQGRDLNEYLGEDFEVEMDPTEDDDDSGDDDD